MAGQPLGVRLSGFFARGGNPPAGERCAAFPLRGYSAARGFSPAGELRGARPFFAVPVARR